MVLAAPQPCPADVDRLWQSFLRRFDLEHTFRLFKQVLGWTIPKIRDPRAADRWTWLIIAVHAQLRLARPLADDLRLPWERPALPGRLTPARVRRGFRNIRAKAAQPGRCTETRQARPRPAARIEEPPPGTPPRRGEDHQTRAHRQSRAEAGRLNGKLRQRTRKVKIALERRREPGKRSPLGKKRPDRAETTLPRHPDSFRLSADGVFARARDDGVIDLDPPGG